MTLDRKDAPADFQSVSRVKHLNDIRGKNLHTFRAFLAMHFEGDRADKGNRALGVFRKAFYLASVRDGFQHVNNPVETELDRIPNGKGKGPDMTPRKPMELEAWDVLVRKNRENDFAFARSLGPKRFHYTLKNIDTGEYERVFWPAEPIVVDILLNSSMRHISSRWADSGEGDELTLTPKNLRMVPNVHSAATPGRWRASFNWWTFQERKSSR